MENKDRTKLLNKLQKLGFINKKTKTNLGISFEEYIKLASNNEIELLDEVFRIKKKKENKVPLSYIEEAFLNYFLLNYH
ncbi:hypothetical protein [Tenacibaculum maritimum]|uniref:hypothetical protein n=1 Tax=Tenacibaculum maritimum TaxID=107401 RepID=UPI003876F224